METQEKNKIQEKYSTNFDLTSLKNDDSDRKYNSVMDEYRRYFGVQKKHKVKNLNRDDIWAFIKYFFLETYGVDINDEDKPGKKYVGKLKESKHRKISYLHWNVKNYEISIEEREEAIKRVSMSIHKSFLTRKYVLAYKTVVKAPNTLWGMKGEFAKFQMKYYQKKNAKNVFKQLDVLDSYKIENNTINGWKEYLTKKQSA